jgi:hypothetical protein
LRPRQTVERSFDSFEAGYQLDQKPRQYGADRAEVQEWLEAWQPKSAVI